MCLCACAHAIIFQLLSWLTVFHEVEYEYCDIREYPTLLICYNMITEGKQMC
jgi:hypothetical protein